MGDSNVALQLGALQARGNVATHGVITRDGVSARMATSLWRRYSSVGGRRCSATLTSNATLQQWQTKPKISFLIFFTR